MVRYGTMCMYEGGVGVLCSVAGMVLSDWFNAVRWSLVDREGVSGMVWNGMESFRYVEYAW